MDARLHVDPHLEMAYNRLGHAFDPSPLSHQALESRWLADYAERSDRIRDTEPLPNEAEN